MHVLIPARRLYSEEELPPEFKLFIPTAPAMRGSTAGATGSDKAISLRGKEAVLDAKTSSTVNAIDKLSEVNEDEIVEDSSEEFPDGSAPEVSEPSSDLDEINRRTGLNEVGTIEKLFAGSPQQEVALSS